MQQALFGETEVVETIRKSAVISSCGTYRYRLARQWREASTLLTFIMLNPSTADADLDDPTIRRCIGFARRDGFGGIRVYNLFALRSTSPTALKLHRDPIGPENDERLLACFEHAAEYCSPIIAAWGAHGSLRGRDRAVMAAARTAGAKLSCLGVTKDGHPKHPLYIGASQPFVPFEPIPSSNSHPS